MFDIQNLTKTENKQKQQTAPNMTKPLICLDATTIGGIHPSTSRILIAAIAARIFLVATIFFQKWVWAKEEMLFVANALYIVQPDWRRFGTVTSIK